MELTSSSSPTSTTDLCSDRDGSPEHQSPGILSRRTSHSRDQGGLRYGIGVVWAQLRPFLPFFLISCLVVALVYLLHIIIYSGPFTDPLFFQKFAERWPKPRQDWTPTLGKTPVEQLGDDKNMT